jgi:hypothetical protein
MSLPYGGFTTMLNPMQILGFAPRQDVRFGSKADICAAKSHVRFTPNSDRESRHRFIVRIVLWSATEEVDHAGRSDPGPFPTYRSPLEQGQINWSQAAAQTEARLGNSRHAPKWAE